jgi:hypothetical protein
MTTSSGGVSTELSGDMADATDAFLARFMPDADPDKKRAPEAETRETDEHQTTEPEDDNEPAEETPEGEEESEDDGKAPKEPQKKYVEDDENTYVKIKVGEEEHEVPAKELKRLFGQEAALTRRSQEVAEQRKSAEAETAKAIATLDVLAKRADEALQPYTQVNWQEAAKHLSDEEFKALQGEAQRAWDNAKFLKEELGGFMNQVSQKQQAERATVAKQTVTELTDQASPNYIEGWSQKTYDDLRSFAIKEGVDKAIVNNVIDAPIIKLMHMAMLYKKGSTNVQTVKPKKGPTKVVKTSTSPSSSRSTQATTATKAMQKLRNSGSMDDATNAFLARMQVSED